MPYQQYQQAQPQQTQPQQQFSGFNQVTFKSFLKKPKNTSRLFRFYFPALHYKQISNFCSLFQNQFPVQNKTQQPQAPTNSSNYNDISDQDLQALFSPKDITASLAEDLLKQFGSGSEEEETMDTSGNNIKILHIPCPECVLSIYSVFFVFFV